MNRAEPRDAELGQTLILFALLLGVLVGLVGITVDAGMAFREKSHSQAAADAAALASVKVLAESGTGVGPDAPTSEALYYATAHGFAAGQVEVNIPPSSGVAAGDTSCVEVTIESESEAHFAQVMGIEMFAVKTSSVACAESGEPFTGVMPWAILESAIKIDGSPTALKYDATGGATGNYGALRLFGSGSMDYEENIKHGTQGSICAESQPDCDDPTEETETGNLVGGTRDGVNYRLANTVTACDEFGEVFSADGSGGYAIIEACNPFSGATGSLRVLLVPVIESFCNGHCTVTLKYFALIFLNDLGKCTGNECTVNGTFVKKVYDPATELGFTPGESTLGVPKLVQ